VKSMGYEPDIDALWSIEKSVNQKCPKCGGTSILPIVYGMPSSELFEQDGITVYIDGCCNDQYELYCKECEHKFVTT